jgi:ribosomal protein S18 acetylase RimI-like enzyme
MDLNIRRADESDAPEISELELQVAQDLSARYGPGHWSSSASRGSVLRRIQCSHVVVARLGAETVATLTLVTKKPWAIDASYFTPVRKALYLINMAVSPTRQRHGIGRTLLQEANRLAENWPAAAIRLDAYDAAAGAGGFYARCGYEERGRRSYRGTPLIYYEHLLGG